MKSQSAYDVFLAMHNVNQNLGLTSLVVGD